MHSDTDLTARAFRDALSRFATGVSVMTTVLEGEPHGMTANAVASLSLEPLLVLVCVERTAAMHRVAPQAGAFALSFLSEDQLHLCHHFADPTRPEGRGQFERVAWRPATTGSPIIEGSVAYVDCRLEATHDGGDHSIFVGEVLAFGEAGGDGPLVFYSGRYGGFRPMAG